MSNSDEYKSVYRRIEKLAGFDRTGTRLEQINALDLSDYDKRRNLLLEIGYQPANFDVWKHVVVFSQFEWTNLIIGIEPMNPNIIFPNRDQFNELIWSVDCWSMIHRLIADNLRKAKVETKRPSISKMIKNISNTFSNDSYSIADYVGATERIGLPIPAELYESIAITSSELGAGERCWIFRRLASNQWEIGKEGETKRLKGVLGFHDLMFALQNRGKDVELETMVGVHAGTLPDFSAAYEIDDEARRQVQAKIDKIQESIELAKSDGDLDLVEQYEIDKAPYEKYLREGTKPSGNARLLCTPSAPMGQI